MTDIKKKRGRPRRFDMAAAEDTALALFWRDGYEATGIAQLTEAIGVAAPSLYAAFGSKAGLFARAVGLYQSRTAPLLTPAFEEDTFAGFVGALLVAAAKVYTQDGCGRGCLVLDGTRNATDPEALALTQGLRDEFHTALVEKFGALGIQDRGRLADTCLTSMIGLSGAARQGLATERLITVATLLADGIIAQGESL